MGLAWVEELEHKKYTIKVKTNLEWYKANIDNLTNILKQYE